VGLGRESEEGKRGRERTEEKEEEGKYWVAEGMGREMGFENHFWGQPYKRDRGQENRLNQ